MEAYGIKNFDERFEREAASLLLELTEHVATVQAADPNTPMDDIKTIWMIQKLAGWPGQPACPGT